MKTHTRAMLFSLAFCIAYTFAYYFDLSPIKYYPFANTVALGAQPGPAILWYGWLCTATLAGIFVAVLVPPRWVARLSPDLVWLLAVLLVVAVLMYEMRWFL